MLQLQMFLDRLLHFWIPVFTTVSVTIIYLLLFGAVQSVELIMCELTALDLYCSGKENVQGKERGECRES